ncbi:sugar phosphate isomerase/epimerase family protein [Pedobacter sp. SAFR-022]|uniref:sugar phosphate isomerase/epimerase family protein n=1 Tax=Pedobacter sp. SAFR-022 TaxID=3436861 RepID=UPI003F80AFC0
MNSRRTFIKQAGIAAAAGLVLPSFACVKSSKVVGLQLYSLRELLPQDPRGVIAKVAAAGYKEVETYGYSAEGGFWGLDPKSFKNLLIENGLTAPSGHYGIDKYIQDGNEEELKSFIAAASAIGSEYLTVPYLGDALRQNADDYKKVAAKLNQAGALCKASGLKIAYHNHDFELKSWGETTGLEIMLKETDPKLVDFEMDIYWVVRSGKDPIQLFDAYPGRFTMWHVKDMDKANNEKNIEVGSGGIDYKTIFKGAKKAGLKHAIMEQENFDMEPYASITQSQNYIKTELL